VVPAAPVTTRPAVSGGADPGVPAQLPSSQTSAVVQALPSLQGLPSGCVPQVFAVQVLGRRVWVTATSSR
jgi:hypothetical protein